MASSTGWRVLCEWQRRLLRLARLAEHLARDLGVLQQDRRNAFDDPVVQAPHSSQTGRQAPSPAASGAASKALRRLYTPRAAGPAVSKPPVGGGRLALAPPSGHLLYCAKCRRRLPSITPNYAQLRLITLNYKCRSTCLRALWSSPACESGTVRHLDCHRPNYLITQLPTYAIA